VSTSRNQREGSYAGWCYGLHRRTREPLKAQLREGPCWYWACRKVGCLLDPAMRADLVRRLQHEWRHNYYRQLARSRRATSILRDRPLAPGVTIEGGKVTVRLHHES
jgi:hypothetical protein